MFDEKVFQMLVSFVVVPLAGFFVKVVLDRIARNEQSLKELKQEIENKYQTKEVAREINQGLKDKLDSILCSLKEVSQKLDKKVDK